MEISTFTIAIITISSLFIGIFLIVLFVTQLQREKPTMESYVVEKPDYNNIEIAIEEYREKLILEEQKKIVTNNSIMIIVILSLFMLLIMFIGGLLLLWLHQITWYKFTIRKFIFGLFYLPSFILFIISLSYTLQSYSQTTNISSEIEKSFQKKEKRILDKLFARFIYEIRQNEMRESNARLSKILLIIGFLSLIPAIVVIILSL